MKPGTEREAEPVLEYAGARREGQSRWGVAAMVCAVVGVVMLVMAPAVSSRTAGWVKIMGLCDVAGAAACCAGGVACGIVGLAQGRRGRECAAMGLFWNVCELLVLFYAVMH